MSNIVEMKSIFINFSFSIFNFQLNICGYGGIGSLPVSAACGRESEQSKGAAVEI